jgi:hypothetical protein
MGCFSGSIANISLSCIADCDANACTQAVTFSDNATDCMLQAALSGKCGGFGSGGGGGGGSILQCLQQACAAPIAACMGAAPCPGVDSGK